MTDDSVSAYDAAAMTFIDQLVQSLDARREQLDGEIDRLTRAREELTADLTAAGPARPASARRPQRRGRRVSRSPRRRGRGSPNGQLSVEKLHGLLGEDGDGLSTAALAQQANAEPAQVLPLLREMEAAGRVRRSGERRGTRWHAVADEEEWISQRAAELAARSSGSNARARAKAS